MIKYYNLLWVFLGGTIFLFVATPDYKVIKLRNGGNEIIERDKRDGTIQTFYPDGTVKTRISYDKDIKEGPATMFYSNGNKHLEMFYRNGKRVGESKKYYKSGALYAVTPFDNNKITGIRTTYYDNGQLKAKAPYYKSMNGLGLVEYTLDGSVVDDRPIIIKKDTYLDHAILKFTISNCYKEAFYTGKLVNGKYLDPSAPGISPLPSTEGYHFVRIDKINEGDDVICSCITKSGNTYVTAKPIDPALLN